MIKINKKKRKENISIKIKDNQEGYSGCLIFLLIVFVVIAAGAGYIYFQWTNIQKLRSERIQKALKEVEENEKIDSIENLNLEELEELKEINPIVRIIIELIPSRLISDYQERENNGLSSSQTEDEETKEKQKIDKNAGELLPDSINVHPAMTLLNYQELENIPEFVFNEIKTEEKYINNQSKFLEFELNFPEREIEELREMEEVPDDITDSMIEDEKDELERLYNIKEVLSWYQKNLQENNWEIIKENEKEGFNYMFQHDRDGYFIILDLENALYTPYQ